MSKVLRMETHDPLHIHGYWVFYSNVPLSLHEQYGVSQIRIGDDLHEPAPIMDGRNAVAIKSNKDYSAVKHIELIYP